MKVGIHSKTAQCLLSGPGQVAHLAPTYAAVNALCLLRNEKAYKVVNRKKLSAWLKTILDPTNGSFSLHVDGESDIRATYCAASVATLCQLEDLPDLFKNTAEWVARYNELIYFN
ncbi:unnamed protein product [Rotaria magnacalcarata]|uniref:Prenyltransferase alpha-alpha toroid domain-containing protein n=1 Tax=Rotaria magnacalcarata TaxID=392030 RepID=A0A8S3H771_9BILA|nr:unnamed protein product [Rotaria magnacalcarata]